MLRSLCCAALLVAAAMAAAGDACTFSPPASNTAAARQDSGCDVTAPYCTWTPANGPPVGRCTVCRVGQAADPCLCDRTTSYCEQGGPTPGTCQPYTLLDAGCIDDNDCITYTNAIVGGGLPLNVRRVPNEVLTCVIGQCKPCDSDTWPDFYVPLGATYTCPGYLATASNALGRYATASSRAGTQIKCQAGGLFTSVNSTINYGYGYNGDWTAWTPASPSPSRAATAASPSSPPAVNSGASALTASALLVLLALV